MTCRSASASLTSSRVDLNASTSPCGNLLMNPTVSVSVTIRPSGSTSRRVVESSVANSWSSVSTSASVRALRSVDLPAFVYPTIAMRTTGERSLDLRLRSRLRATTSSSRLSSAMRVRASRRSVSSWVSPGPLVPMPPPRRSRCLHRPLNLGRRYSICASSTWSLPSRVCACMAKMSRMSAVRSTTLTSPMIRSRLACCEGVRSSSNTTRVASRSRAMRATSSALPEPMNVRGFGFSSFWETVATISAPAVSASRRSSARESSTSQSPGPRSAATRTARSRNRASTCCGSNRLPLILG